jgi:hypothetical protein
MKTIICVVVATLVGVVHSAEAQNAAQAEQLFREAKQLFDAGKIEEACKTWEASERLDPSLGTLTNIANCREKHGDLATAWEAFVTLERRTAGIGKYDTLNSLGRTRAAALEPRLSYLTINVPDEVRVEGLEVYRDGVLIETGAWNRALPIDGGHHTITGRAPGHEAWSTTVDVEAEQDKKAVEVPRFKAIRNPQGGGGGGGKTIIIDRSEPSTFTFRRKISAGVAGGAVAGVAVGIAFALASTRSADKATSKCPSLNCEMYEEANALNKKSRDQALFANVGFGVGAAALAGAVFLWITGKPEHAGTGPAVTTSIGPRHAGAAVTFHF